MRLCQIKSKRYKNKSWGHPMKKSYMELLHTVERLQRLNLEVVKKELDSINVRNINNVQALIVYHIGESELSVGELTQRGYYLGSNASYNLRKLVETGYIEQFPSPHDKRSFHIRLSKQGLELFHKIDKVMVNHANHVTQHVLPMKEIESIHSQLLKWEGFFREALTTRTF